MRNKQFVVLDSRSKLHVCKDPLMLCAVLSAVFCCCPLLQARHQQYRSPSSILAALLDPVNSLAPTDGGNRKPPISWFTADELQSARKEAERLGTAIGSLPATQLPPDLSPA